MKKYFILALIVGLMVVGGLVLKNNLGNTIAKTENLNDPWRQKLTAEEYYILREKGTERPYSGKLNKETRKGTYYSVGCDKPLFRSEDKYDSGTGWPSFTAPICENAVVLQKETVLVMIGLRFWTLVVVTWGMYLTMAPHQLVSDIV